jgi:Fe-S cluster assembly ATPase SufC
MLDMDEKLMNRSVNEGFSGGEKKRNEILQMAVLEPSLPILEETDSGLDIDALRIVAQGSTPCATGARHHRGELRQRAGHFRLADIRGTEEEE